MSDDALLKAAVIEARMDSHDKTCSERYGEINKSFSRVHDRLDWIMRGMVGILLAMLSYLLANGVPWGN